MKAYLSGGPANGRVISHPYLHIYRYPVPKPISALTVGDCLQEPFDPTLATPNVTIADYRFTGHATVNMNGEVGYMIYEFEGMEPC